MNAKKIVQTLGLTGFKSKESHHRQLKSTDQVGNFLTFETAASALTRGGDGIWVEAHQGGVGKYDAP